METSILFTTIISTIMLRSMETAMLTVPSTIHRALVIVIILVVKVTINYWGLIARFSSTRLIRPSQKTFW